MKHTILIFLLFVTTQTLFAQRFHVEAFREDPSDLAAIRFPVTDVNDDACAIIKVRSNIDGILFDSNLGITKIDERPDGMWLYVSPGERALRFMRQGVITKDYNFPAGMRIESSKVYILELLATTGDIDDPEIETQWLIITSEPSGADLYINDQPAGRTPYQNELPVGTYQWRLESSLYLSKEGFVSLESGDANREQFHVTLDADYGTLVIRSRPESGADIALNGLNANESTPATLQRIPSGEHTITLSMDDYASASRQIELSAGERKDVVIDMQPTFAVVRIDTEPSSDIYINNQRRGSGSWQGRLSTGVYTFEARLDKYKAHSERKQVSAGENINLNLQPEPITGNLRVTSMPIGAHVRLNGEDRGTAPNTFRNLLIGEYEIALSLPGHATINERVTIAEGETAEVSVELPVGMEVTINSEPSGAELFINGERVGTTPYISELSFGSHQLRLVNRSRTVEERIQISQGGRSSFSFDVKACKAQNAKEDQIRDSLFDDLLQHRFLQTIGRTVEKRTKISQGDRSSFNFDVVECPAEVTFTYRGRRVTYGVIERGGLCWMDRNLGASRVPTSMTDSQGYGDLFQWGRGDDGHQKRSSGTKTRQSNADVPGHNNFITVSSSPRDWRSPQNNNLWQGENGINNPCPPGWRVPTEAELNAERRSWTQNNSAGAYASTLKWPVGGDRSYGGGALYNVGSLGGVWSSSVSGSTARNLSFYSGNAYMLSLSRAGGMSVRCVRD